jgi:thiamine biosynthesis protein ThiI
MVEETMTVRDSGGVPAPGTDARSRGEATLSGSGRTQVSVMVRFTGELTTKARGTRAHFQRRLARNIQDAISSCGVKGRVREDWSRMYVEGDEPLLDALPRVFGISSLSPIEGECPARLEAIVELGHRLYAERVRGRRYAVKARRSGTHDFGSYDVQRELGAALNPGARVDLDDPEVTVRVEVRDETARLFSERLQGAGGLPLGVQGRAVALLSGGYDSAVAAWMALRRGVELDYLFCNLGGGAYRRMVTEVARVLARDWSYGSRPTLHVVDFGEVVEAMRRNVKASYLQIVLKRLMYRSACRVAAACGAEAVITGEAMGQVSSQTLSNLRAIDEAADLPVLRPLVGFDKPEIIERARAIGTYEISSRVREYCALTPEHPVTASTPERAAAQEARLDAAVLEEALGRAERLDLRSLAPEDVVTENLFLDDVPRGAVVLDMRPEREYRTWHWPGAERCDSAELEMGVGSLDRDRTYVLYCEVGTRSAHLAERLQMAGLEAYSFRGGVPALRRLASGREEGE